MINMTSIPVKYIAFFSTILLITAECKTIPESIHDLAYQLKNVVADINGNVLFSPLSVHTALLLCHQGSSGTTRKILEDVLGLPSDPFEIAQEYKAILTNFNETLTDLSLSIANGVYLKTNYNLKSQFREVVSEYFGANIESVDFTKSSLIAKQINDWVLEKTKHKIQDIVQESTLTEDTRVVLVNAVYFKGPWAQPFHMLETKKDKFYISPSETVDCEMMQMTGEFYYDESLVFAKFLQIPYGDKKDIFFTVMLPVLTNDLQKIETEFTAKKHLLTLRKGHLESVQVRLPKFKLETNIDLRQPLQDIGLENIFSEKANFSEMINSHEPLTISKIIHKTFIDINENGTEAAAATSAVIRKRRSLNLHQYTFHANRPFLFYVSDSASATILFQGRLMNPNPKTIHDEL